MIELNGLFGEPTIALDMTEGQPAGHCVRSYYIGLATGRRLGLNKAAISDVYYAILLTDLGCSSNVARICALYLTEDHAFTRNFKKIDDHFSISYELVYLTRV